MTTLGTSLSNNAIKQPLPILPLKIEIPKAKFHQSALSYSRLLTDDYVHKKFLTLKYSARGWNFTCNAKGTLDFKVGPDNKDIATTSSELKLATLISGKTIETRFDNKGQIRLWSNLGTYDFGTPLTLTTKLKTNNLFNRLTGHVCLEHRGKRTNIFTRLELKENSIPLLNEKIIFNFSPIQMGYILKLNLQEISLARYNVFFVYNQPEYSLYAEHFSKNKKNFELGKVILGGVYRMGAHDFVVKAAYRPHKANHFRVKAGIISDIDKNCTVRAKVDNSAKLSFGARYRTSSTFSFVAGSQINLLNPGAYLTNKAIPIPIGLSLEFALD